MRRGDVHGDVHGDVNALRSCLQIAGLVDPANRWTGGTAHLVQLGDILDRGDAERGCIDLLFSLQEQARAAGGNVHILLGNHEIMNVDHEIRYVTRATWDGWRAAPATATYSGGWRLYRGGRRLI